MWMCLECCRYHHRVTSGYSILPKVGFSSHQRNYCNVPVVDFSHCQCIYDVIEWSSENVLLLIEKYREFKLLWNVKHQFYYHKIKKNGAWEEIASEMNTTAEKVKKKINTLLSVLQRKKIKIKKSLVTRRSMYSYNFFTKLIHFKVRITLLKIY